ncbi:MAG: hypothetical protein EOP85_08575 [Verrucomicrobiaceae bacterium]|nr:MAG: hypothetical protein EOP85_08575 [Verrucomicrobiaceae bacterium]
MAESLGPDLEITRPDVVTLDLSSRRKPLGDSLNALELEDTAIWHARARTPDLAHLAAIHPETMGTVLEHRDLTPLPLDLLGSVIRGQNLIDRLELWGLKGTFKNAVAAVGGQI